MADKQITDLTPITTPSDTDKLLIRHGETDCNIDYNKLADAILGKLSNKTYTLDQGTKSLVAALNELNSNCVMKSTGLPANVDLNTIITTGFYRFGDAAGSPNKPPINCSYGQMIVSRGYDTMAQIIFPYNTPDMFAVRTGSRIGKDDLGLTSWAVYNSKSSITVINQDIEYTDKIKVTEYFRYSIFGSVCMVDIGGIILDAAGYSIPIAINMPIAKNRTTFLLTSDTSKTMKSVSVTVAYTVNSNIMLHLPPDLINVPLYGQMIYLV